MPPRHLVILTVFLLGAGGGARAEPLPKEECDKLLAEQTLLSGAGVRQQFERGGQWGRANLSPEQIARVQRFISVEEQLNFRCGLVKLRTTLPVGEEGGEQELDEKGNPIPAKAAEPGNGTRAKGKAVPNAKKPEKSPDGAATAKTAAPPKPKAPAAKAEGGAAPAAKPQPKSKAKADDAYRPPRTGEPNADPFAGQQPARKAQ